MKKRTFGIAKMLLSAFTFPLWFLEMLPDSAHLPNQAGEIVEVVFWHSMFENCRRALHPALAYLAFAVAIASIVTNAVALKFPQNKKWQTVGTIAFWVAIALFAVLLLFASFVSYHY